MSRSVWLSCTVWTSRTRGPWLMPCVSRRIMVATRSQMALDQRQPADGVILHADRGSQPQPRICRVLRRTRVPQLRRADRDLFSTTQPRSRSGRLQHEENPLFTAIHDTLPSTKNSSRCDVSTSHSTVSTEAGTLQVRSGRGRHHTCKCRRCWSCSPAERPGAEADAVVAGGAPVRTGRVVALAA